VRVGRDQLRLVAGVADAVRVLVGDHLPLVGEHLVQLGLLGRVGRHGVKVAEVERRRAELDRPAVPPVVADVDAQQQPPLVDRHRRRDQDPLRQAVDQLGRRLAVHLDVRVAQPRVGQVDEAEVTRERERIDADRRAVEVVGDHRQHLVDRHPRPRVARHHPAAAAAVAAAVGLAGRVRHRRLARARRVRRRRVRRRRRDRRRRRRRAAGRRAVARRAVVRLVARAKEQTEEGAGSRECHGSEARCAVANLPPFVDAGATTAARGRRTRDAAHDSLQAASTVSRSRRPAVAASWHRHSTRLPVQKLGP
jgi:hypothetical protein